MTGMASLKAVGYWRPSERIVNHYRTHGYVGRRRTASEIAALPERPPSPLPSPAALVAPGWNQADLPSVLAYLRAGQEWIRFNGWSSCRFECGLAPSALGDRDLTDGVWLWPEGLAHYVEVHAVRLPDEFIDHMRSQGWRVSAEPIARWVDRAVADRPGVDFSFWIAWSCRMAASASA
jgi:hypothetical protein